MAQTKALVKLVKIKIGLVTSQKDQVQEALENYVHKMTSKARAAVETEEQDVNTLNEVSSALDTVLNYLLQTGSHMEDDTPTTLIEAEDQLSTSSSETLSLPQPLSTLQHEKSHVSEPDQVSKLHHHLEVLETALTTCRNEISQANTDKNEVRDKLDKLENHIHQLDKHEERLASLEKLTQQTQSNMTKEIKDLQKTFKDNMRKTKRELDTKMDSIDEEFQKTQGQNMTTINEQASKLGKVEKKLKKMKEEEQERWSQIDSIHTDVESLKDDQRDNQQLVKIQGLEKHMEKLTSQCDSLQDQAEKIEPVIQMSQELAHKISTLATDEQVQELIQTTTATSRSLEELTSKVEDTERSVRGCVTQSERYENRRREMEDRLAVLETQRQKDLSHYTKELEETNSLYKAVCQLVDQRVTPLRRLQRMLNDYHKQVEKREEISTRLDDVVKKVKDISTQLDKHESFRDIPTRGIRNAPRDQPSTGTKFFSSICRECTVCHYTGVVSYTGLSTTVPIGQFIAASPLTPKCPSFSFEITRPGKRCRIAIGVCPNSYPPNRQPGWNIDSIGYHADDGKVYKCAVMSATCFGTCGQGDIMKCELNFSKRSIKFFKNDKQVYETLSPLNFANLHAAIGLHSVGEAVRLLEKEPWQMS